MNPTRPENATAARVELAKITNVNRRTFSLDVMTEFTHRPLVDIPFMVPYLGYGGSGIGFMPEIDDLCYVVIPGDNSGPFVLGFVPTGRSYLESERDGGDYKIGTDEDGPDFSEGRLPMESGDIRFSTSDNNFVIIRKGGIVQIGSTNLCQTMYIPVENLVRHFFQRYQSISPLGSFEWGHASISGGIKSGDETAVLVKYDVREIIQDEAASVEIRVGRLDGSVLDSDEEEVHLMGNEKELDGLGMTPGQGLLSIVINHKGSSVNYVFQLDDDGNNFLKVAGDVHAEVTGSVFVRAGSGFKFERSDSVHVSLTSSDELKAYIKSCVMEAIESVTIKAQTMTVDCPDVIIGSGPVTLPVVVDNKLMTWIASHTHTTLPTPLNPLNPLVTSALVTGPPIVPPPPSVAINVKAS
jgi:hypothetical protein